jgi:hypothetical protein
MKVFDHTPTEVRHGHSYPTTAPNHTPAWIAGLVGLAVVIGVFAHEYGSWRRRSRNRYPKETSGARFQCGLFLACILAIFDISCLRARW